VSTSSLVLAHESRWGVTLRAENNPGSYYNVCSTPGVAIDDTQLMCAIMRRTATVHVATKRGKQRTVSAHQPAAVTQKAGITLKNTTH